MNLLERFPNQNFAKNLLEKGSQNEPFGKVPKPEFCQEPFGKRFPKDNKIKLNKKGQVTIFIVAGVVIVAIILLFFLLRKTSDPNIGGSEKPDPESFMETCLKDEVYEVTEMLGAQGGYIEPKLYIEFKFEEDPIKRKIAYLCYNQNFYLRCINQQPLLLKHLEEEIKNQIKNDTQDCFDSLSTSLDKEGYVVEARYRGFNLELKEKAIELKINASLVLTRNEETIREKDFKVRIPTRFYGLALIAREIVNQESRYCSFADLGYEILYSSWKIDRYNVLGQGSIYSIQNKDTNEKFRLATRSCILPTGFG